MAIDIPLKVQLCNKVYSKYNSRNVFNKIKFALAGSLKAMIHISRTILETVISKGECTSGVTRPSSHRQTIDHNIRAVFNECRKTKPK